MFEEKYVFFSIWQFVNSEVFCVLKNFLLIDIYKPVEHCAEKNLYKSFQYLSSADFEREILDFSLDKSGMVTKMHSECPEEKLERNKSFPKNVNSNHHFRTLSVRSLNFRQNFSAGLPKMYSIYPVEQFQRNFFSGEKTVFETLLDCERTIIWTFVESFWQR